MNTKLFINALMFVALIFQIFIGIVIWLINHGQFEASLIAWINVHIINGIIFVALVAIHIYTNRRWVILQISGS